MKVELVEFPETSVAVVEHRGPPDREHESAKRLISWRVRHGVSPLTHRTFGIHYTDPFAVPPEQHRVDFGVSYGGQIRPNEEGVITKVIPRLRCAVARHHSSLGFNTAAEFLGRVWLPKSGEALGDFPMFFHYINVGPGVQESEMLTDVYLPLASSIIAPGAAHGA